MAVGLCSTSDVTTTLVSPRVPHSRADGTQDAELSCVELPNHSITRSKPWHCVVVMVVVEILVVVG